MKCSICESKSRYYLKKKILNKYSVKYYKCVDCSFIEPERPRYWIKEAYSSAIIDRDTGLMSRNLIYSKVATILHMLLCHRKDKVLDYAGGYGVMTRLLRDIGIDAYWKDKYSKNLFAKNFNDDTKTKYGMVTAFEFMEHLDNPIKEIKNIFTKYTPKIFLFSTIVHDGNPPRDWWYYVESGGQHISLYTTLSLDILAKKIGLRYSTNGVDIHLFSRYKIPNMFMSIISKFADQYSILFKYFYKSKTFLDHMSIK